MILNEQSLSDCMSALIWNATLVEKYYKPFALLRKEDDVSILLLLLENLSKVSFDLRTNDSALDDPEYWTTVNIFPAGRKPGAMAQAPKAQEGSLFSIFSSDDGSSSSSSSSSGVAPSLKEEKSSSSSFSSASSVSSSSSSSKLALSSSSSTEKEGKKKKEKKETMEVYFDEIPQDEPSPVVPRATGRGAEQEDPGLFLILFFLFSHV